MTAAAWDTAGPARDDGPGYEWYRELYDEPARCTCTRLIVATVEETLDCPGNWWWTGTAWAHIIGYTP